MSFGPGYRVYYLQDGQRVILLLSGGDKATQQRDIERAYRWPRTTGARRATIMAEGGKYARFDAADYLDDLDDVATYLEIALQESAEDPTAVPRALGVIARSQNMSELARRVGMSRDGLYKALSADGNPTWSTILKVTNALGLRVRTAHRRLTPLRAASAGSVQSATMNHKPAPFPAAYRALRGRHHPQIGRVRSSTLATQHSSSITGRGGQPW